MTPFEKLEWLVKVGQADICFIEEDPSEPWVKGSHFYCEYWHPDFDDWNHKIYASHESFEELINGLYKTVKEKMEQAYCTTLRK
jgi:hypothetical protein